MSVADSLTEAGEFKKQTRAMFQEYMLFNGVPQPGRNALTLFVALSCV